MKKLISGLIAAFLLTAGFVAVSAETAQAACKPTRYVQCQTTSTKVTAAPRVIKAGKPAKLKVSVKSRGNVEPKGTLTITVKGPGGFSKVIKVSVGVKSVNLGKLKKAGKYKVTVAFKGADGFNDSKSTTTITVKKK